MRKPNQSFVLRISDTYIAIICRNYQKYSIFDPHARNSHGDIDGNGLASLFNFENSVALTNYLTRLAAGKNEQIDLYSVYIQIISTYLEKQESPIQMSSELDSMPESETQLRKFTCKKWMLSICTIGLSGHREYINFKAINDINTISHFEGKQSIFHQLILVHNLREIHKIQK